MNFMMGHEDLLPPTNDGMFAIATG